jgi:hypothetical protein
MDGGIAWLVDTLERVSQLSRDKTRPHRRHTA